MVLGVLGLGYCGAPMSCFDLGLQKNFKVAHLTRSRNTKYLNTQHPTPKPQYPCLKAPPLRAAGEVRERKLILLSLSWESANGVGVSQ